MIQSHRQRKSCFRRSARPAAIITKTNPIKDRNAERRYRVVLVIHQILNGSGFSRKY